MMNNTISKITSVLTGLQKARRFSVQAQSKAVDGALDKMKVLKADLKEPTELRNLKVFLSWEMAEGTFLKSNYSKGSRLDAAIQFVTLVVEAVQSGMIPGSIGSSLSSEFLINAEGVNPSGSLPVPEYPKVLGQQLLEAAQGNQIEEALNLIERGANVLAKDVNGWTWLHQAALKEWTEFALVVLDRLPLADQRRLLFKKDYYGKTWLHLAAFNKRTEFVLAVLKRLPLADKRRLLFEKNDCGETAADFARRRLHPKMAEALDKLAAQGNA